ncbi:MAG: hypothetical protein H7263_15180 [Candidatus Sericytochromatia bacterium]|nr:hypothetical protein [Candidatus Sericytochromatia bacterium]
MMIKNKEYKRSVLTKYSPLWIILLTVATTLIQVVGTRYIKEQKLTFTKSDIKSALIKSIVGYFGFGSKYKKI